MMELNPEHPNHPDNMNKKIPIPEPKEAGTDATTGTDSTDKGKGASGEFFESFFGASNPSDSDLVGLIEQQQSQAPPQFQPPTLAGIISDLLQRVFSLSGSLKEKEKKFDKYIRDSDEEIAELEGSIDDMAARICDLQDELRDKDQVVEVPEQMECDACNGTRRNEIGNGCPFCDTTGKVLVSEAFNRLRQKYALADLARQRLEKEIDELEAIECETLEAEKDRRDEEIDGLRSQLETSTKVIREKSKEVGELKSQLGKANAEIEKISRQSADPPAESRECGKCLGHGKIDCIGHGKIDASGIGSQGGTFSHDLVSRTVECDRCGGVGRTMPAGSAPLENRYNTAKKIILEQDETIASLKGQLRQARDGMEELRSKCQQAKGVIAAKNEEIRDHKVWLQNACKSRDECESKCQANADALESAVNRAEKYKEEVETLKRNDHTKAIRGLEVQNQKFFVELEQEREKAYELRQEVRRLMNELEVVQTNRGECAKCNGTGEAEVEYRDLTREVGPCDECDGKEVCQ